MCAGSPCLSFKGMGERPRPRRRFCTTFTIIPFFVLTLVFLFHHSDPSYAARRIRVPRDDYPFAHVSLTAKFRSTAVTNNDILRHINLVSGAAIQTQSELLSSVVATVVYCVSLQGTLALRR